MNLDYATPYFNMSVAACHVAGRRGGRAGGRTRRLRLAARAVVVQPDVTGPVETTREAIEKLDRQFPWLRGAERRTSRPPA